MLRWRLILGFLLISVLVALCWIDHAAPEWGIVLVPVVWGLSLLATGEILAMYRARGWQLPTASVYTAVLLVPVAAGAPVVLPSLSKLSAIGPAGWLALGLAIGFLFSLIAAMRRYQPQSESIQPGDTTIRLGLAILAVAYVGGLLGFLILLRIAPIGPRDHDWGLLALISMIVVVKLGDTGQYTVGHLCGRHKMAPTLSPGKTWEGTTGGLVCSCVGAWWMLAIVPGWLGWTGAESRVPITVCLCYGLAVGTAGVIGDLAESLLKRDTGVKDSSTWMPGFGGVLDMLDSLLVAAPVAYLFWAAGVVGGW